MAMCKGNYPQNENTMCKGWNDCLKWVHLTYRIWGKLALTEICEDGVKSDTLCRQIANLRESVVESVDI